MPDAPAVTTETPGTTGTPGAPGAAKTPAQGPTSSGARTPPAGAAQGSGRAADGRFQGKEGEQPKPEAQAERRRYKVKSKTGGDEEIEVGEDEISKALSFAREGHHRLRLINEEKQKLEQEKAAIQREREALKSIWRDPAALRKHLHENVTDQDEAHRIKVQLVKLDLVDREKTPEQRRLEELEAREAERAEQDEKTAQQQAEQEIQERAERIRPHFVKTLTAVLDMGGLPATPRTLTRAAEAYRENHQNGYGLDEKGLAGWIKEELDAELSARMADPELTDQQFVERYADVYQRARRIAVEEMRQRRAEARGEVQRQAPTVRAPESQRTEGGRKPPPRQLSPSEWRKL